MADTTATPAASTGSAPTSGTSTPASNGVKRGPSTTSPPRPATPRAPANEPMEASNEPMATEGTETPEAPPVRKYKYQADDGTETEATLDDLLKDYKRKVKVGDQEVELGLEELDKGYLRRDFFDRKVREAHNAIQESQQIRKLLEERPVDLLRHLFKGDQAAIIDFAQKLVDPYVKRAEMSPEQRALDEEREKLNAEKAEIERWRQEQQELKRQARLDAIGQKAEAGILAALQKVGLDHTDPLIVGRLAQAREWALDNGLPYSYEDLATDMAQREQARIDAAAEKKAAERLAKLQQTPMAAVKTPTKPTNGVEEEKPKRHWISPDEYAALRNKRIG